jgi:hypothetical protein
MKDKELRELGAWIAEHVMGWKIHRRNTAHYVEANKINDIDYFVAAPHDWSPTTDPAAAMMVLENCVEKLSSFDVCIWKGATSPFWFCGERENTRDITRFSKAETLPLAICLFAKKLFSK